MATFYGGWVSTDDFRAILDATVSNTSATQCTVKLVVKIQSNYAYASSSGRASATCNGTTRSASVAYSAGKTTTLMTESFTVSRGSSSKSISVSGKVWQLNASSAYSKGSTASGKVTIPAIDYDAPNAPSSCAASRVSDTSAKVTWTNGSTATLKPRSSVKVERQTDGGSWSQIASVGASTANYTDNSISANHRYAYRVRSYGAGGYSGYSTSGYIYTTPAAPSSVSITKTSGTQVSLSVGTSSAPYATAWEVQESLNGAEWAAVGSFTTFPQTVDVGGGTAKLRVRAVRGSLASAWAESNTVTTIVAPNAPTITNKPASVVATGSTLKVGWTRNHPDGTAQTSAQVGYTVDSGSETVATVTGSTSTYTLPASVSAKPCAVKVRVRTKGLAADWGAWSSYYSFTVAVPPEAHFTAPGIDGAKIGDLPLTVAWEVVDDTGVAAQTLQLTDEAGRVLHTSTPATGAREYEFGASTYQLANATAYRLVLTVRGGSSLTVTTERTFAMSFAEPSRPSADVELDESAMSQAVTVHAGPSTSDTGEVIEVSATPGTLVPGFEVYGRTRQNLWSNPPTGTEFGQSITANDNGSITISGTYTGSGRNYSATTYALRPGSTYTVSVDKARPQSAGNGGFSISCHSDTVQLLYVRFGGTISVEGNTVTFTVPSDTIFCRCNIIQSTGITGTGTYRIMLNEGDTAEPWCPPGINGVEPSAIVTAGKNLWHDFSSGAVTEADGGGITVTSPSWFVSGPKYPVSLKKGTILTLSKDATDNQGVVVGPGVAFYDTQGNDIGQGAVTVYGSNKYMTFSLVSDASYVMPYWNGNISATTTVKVQLELGSTATEYEPPVVTSTPIDMQGQALYSLPDGTRDVLQVDGTGKMIVERSIGDIVSYNGEAIGDAWLASELGADGNPATGAHVIYLLDEPQEVELGSVTMPEFPADPTTVWAVSDIPGEVAVAYPDTDSLSVTRVLDDGSRWLVADGLADGEQAIDPLPPLNAAYSYEVTASTGAGAIVSEDVPQRIDSRGRMALNFGQAAGVAHVMGANAKVSYDESADGELYHFADGGESGGLPVFYGTGDIDASGSVSFELMDRSERDRFKRSARLYPVGWFRDAMGGRIRAKMGYSESVSAGGIAVWEESVDMDEVIFEEAW